MGKPPAFQFYTKDWLCDPHLSMASHTSKGIWIDLLCFMWQNEGKGIIQGKLSEVQKMLRVNSDEFKIFLEEAMRLKFANVTCNGDVTNCNTEVTIINRRMFRDQKEKDNTRLRVAKYRQRKKGNENETLHSPAASATPSSLPKKAAELPSEEEIQEGSKSKIENHIKQTVNMLYNEKIFPKAHSFANQMKKQNKNPRAILHVLSRCYLCKPDKPWAYCHKILETEDGNYHERDYRKAHKKGD